MNSTRTPTKRSARSGEEGYILVAVMFLLALLIISLAVALPRVREDIQRDREIETMNRGKQYIRAIKLYYKKFQRYPPNIDALVKTNEIRFLRKRYTDPITGKDDWKPIQYGQQKTPLAMGFFGQPLAGAAIAGTGPGVAGATPIAGGSNGSFGGSTFSNGGALSGGNSFSGGSSMFGSSATGSPTGTGTGGSTGTGGTDSGSSGSDAGSGAGLSSNQTFGGGGIIGFSPGSEKQSILVYKKKDHYNEWEFLYSPLADQMMQGGGNLGTIGQPVGGTNGNGVQNGNSGVFSNSPSMGSPTAPTTPTSPTSPQQ